MSLRPAPRKRDSEKPRFEDQARFLRSWFEKPLIVGSVTPSSRSLARTMASFVDPRMPGPVIEIGPGTGPVTEALIGRGIEQERLVLVEFGTEFCALLKRRFPRATIVQGDAYAIRDTVAPLLDQPAIGCLSSLPLFTKPMEQRLDLLAAAHDMMVPGAPFIQFTYAIVPPIPARSDDYVATASERVWRNVPPARVWVYRRP